MNSKLTTALCTGVFMVTMAFGSVSAFARDYDRDEEVQELREELQELREELREARDEARTELHEARGDRHSRIYRRGSDRGRVVINGVERDMTPAERAEFDRDMAEFEREMEDFGREMAHFGEELGRELRIEFEDFDDGMAEFAAEMAEFAIEMAGLEGQIMRDLEESGLRIETDANGNDTVWLSGDHSNGNADMRVVSTGDGDDLVYFYFNGFEEDYDFVLEDGPRDTTIVHAYDTDAVSFETSRRHNGNVETDLNSRGQPQLTIRTRDTDDYEVVRLNRRRFN